MGVNETLAHLSNNLIYSAMAAYAVALIAFAVDLSGRGRVANTAAARDKELTRVGASGPEVSGAGAGGRELPPTSFAAGDRPTEKRQTVAMAIMVTWLAFALHVGGVVTRGLSVDRAPWGNMYEFSISGAMVVIGVYLISLWRADLRFLGTFVVGPVLLSLGLAVAVFYTDAAQLVPALQSTWLVIHVSVAFVASALFVIGFSLTVLQLVQDRRQALAAAGRPPTRGAFMEKLPTAEVLDRTSYRLYAVAFPLWTFTLMAGAIWAEKAWGRYWNWDPKEIWSFIIWVAYAAYLHARATRGWDGRRAAYLACVAFLCLMFNWFGVNIFFSGLHSYAGIE
ncbi:c-type cytochrome biogenesis protein CcsB [Kineosporia sp. J2-2]|uniref:C-type cytochrome biogenesis protein CcsB n=1 Tax=Kineosporia corallincola TaxID=2835133 RepID=A0ABS5TA62_9ACTN|nr:c-type cytochrome biogenesis protein CcsB [Kineosporia corallincola]MBT0767753.1 c-type cytochrome biogenesis protein CcsB [Kineosporia corallincola]